MERAAPAARPRERVDAWAVALLVGLCAVWGLQQVSVKLAFAGGLPPLFQALMRSLVAVACVCAWTAWRQGRAGLYPLWPRGPVRGPAAVTAVIFGLEFVALYQGVRLTTASRGVLFLYTAPFFTAAGAHLLIPGERLTLRPLLGLLAAFAGVALVFARGLAHGEGSRLGDMLCLFSAMTWAANTVLVKAIPALRASSAASVLVFQLGGGVPVMVLAALLTRQLHWPHATALAWALLAFQSVVVAFATYLAWFWLVLHYPAGRISAFTFLTPMFGIAAGAAILGEPVGPELVAGVAAIAVGLRLLND